MITVIVWGCKLEWIILYSKKLLGWSGQIQCDKSVCKLKSIRQGARKKRETEGDRSAPSFIIISRSVWYAEDCPMVRIMEAVCTLRPATESDWTARRECSLYRRCCRLVEPVKYASRFTGHSYAVRLWALLSHLLNLWTEGQNSWIKLKRRDSGAWFQCGLLRLSYTYSHII